VLADADSAYRRGETPQLTVADLDRAYRPIKAFQTRYGARYGFAVEFSRPAVERGAAPALTLFA
jgi:hypothetical protein